MLAIQNTAGWISWLIIPAVMCLSVCPTAELAAQEQEEGQLQGVTLTRTDVRFDECDAIVSFALRNNGDRTILYKHVSATTGTVSWSVRDGDEWTWVQLQYLGIQNYDIALRSGETAKLWVRVPGQYFGRPCRIRVNLRMPERRSLDSEPFVVNWP